MSKTTVVCGAVFFLVAVAAISGAMIWANRIINASSRSLGSKHGEVVSEVSIGVVRDASILPVAFNQANKTQVKAERMFVVLSGAYSVPLGAEAIVRTYADKERFLCFEENNTCYPMW